MSFTAVASYVQTANLVAHAMLIAGALWGIAFPSRRLYPMMTKTPAYYVMWLLFLFVFTTNAGFVYMDWNSGPWQSPLRFWVAVPLVLIGVSFLTWGITTLGSRNTSGIKNGFVARGPYLISRNPQYVGDFFIFAGFIVLSNSGIVLVTHLLTILVFVIAPIAEEPWLHEHYGEDYDDYKTRVPRFL